MTKKFRVRVYETVIECFDCEVEIEVPEGMDEDDEWELLNDAVEERRINGEDEREFMEISETDWEKLDETGAP